MVPTLTFSYATCIVRGVRDRWKRILTRQRRASDAPASTRQHRSRQLRANIDAPATRQHRSRPRASGTVVVTRERPLQERLSRRMIAVRIGAAAPAAAYRSVSA
jgi:hypothetical protein